MTEFSDGMIQALRNQQDEAQEHARKARESRDQSLAVAREMAQSMVWYEQRAQELGRLIAYADPDHKRDAVDETSAKQLTEHQKFVAGLREAAEFFEMRPEVPLPAYPELTVYARSSEADEDVAATARAAKLAGLTARRESPRKHFKAEMRFADGLGLKFISTSRTDSTWTSGDPLPDWFVQEQALYGGEDAAPRWCDECGSTVGVTRVRKGVGETSQLLDLCRTCELADAADAGDNGDDGLDPQFSETGIEAGR